MEEEMQGLSNQQRCRRAWINFLSKRSFSHVVSLGWHERYDTSRTRAISHLGQFIDRIDRKLLGRRFRKKPDSERSSAIFFIEHPINNFHVHGLLKVNAANMPVFNDFIAGPKSLWKIIVPSGTCVIKKIDLLPDPFINYATKHIHFATSDNIILDFLH